MPKKKSSRKNKQLTRIIAFVAEIFGIAAGCMGLVKFVTYERSSILT